MTDDSLTWAAASASTMKHSFLMAQALAQFQYLLHMSDEDLASYLQCSPDNLPQLALCRKPQEGSDSRDSILKIAQYVGCSRERLELLLFQVERSQRRQ